MLSQNIFFHTYDVTWGAEPAWSWTAVEAHLAIICASAPALKVFFKQYFSLSSITGSWKDSSRRRSFLRKGYKGKFESATYGTSSTASKAPNLNTTINAGDLELGQIEVVHEVDIDTESMPIDEHDEFIFIDNTNNDSKDCLHSVSRLEGHEMDHSSKPQSISGRIHAWRNQEH